MVCAHVRQDQAPPPHHSDLLGMSAQIPERYYVYEIIFLTQVISSRIAIKLLNQYRRSPSKAASYFSL